MNEKNELEIVTQTSQLSVGVDSALRYLADVLSTDISPKTVANIYVAMKDWEDTLGDLASFVRRKLLSHLKASGERSETGSLKGVIEGWQLEARVRNTGFDDKRVEALLRAKHIDVERGMNATISYKASPDKLADLVLGAQMTEDELETCRHAVEYAVQRPKKV